MALLLVMVVVSVGRAGADDGEGEKKRKDDAGLEGVVLCILPDRNATQKGN